MHTETTVTSLYNDLGKALKLNWVGGKDSASHKFEPGTSHNFGMVSYFNLIHSSQVQVISPTELRFLSNLEPGARAVPFNQLFSPPTVIIVFTDDIQPPDALIRMAEENCVGLFTSPLPGAQVINELLSYLARSLAAKISLHGVFMEVLSLGVLLTGASGVGKSELALELLTRGHRLIADDAPLFARIAPDIIIGTAPDVLQDFLEVRGLGVLNMRKMYGDSAIKPSKYLKLIVDLQPLDNTHNIENRLVGTATTRDVLGLEIPVFTLPVAPGRNLAVLVEAAVRNHILRFNSSYYADKDIVRRQQEAMQRGEEP